MDFSRDGLDEIIETERYEDGAVVELDDEPDESDLNASQAEASSSAVPQEEPDDAEFTLTVLINGKMFVLAGNDRGTCTVCKKSYTTANQASGLTKHLVSKSNIRPLKFRGSHSFLFYF